jgi:type IV pilus assembly protein PilP
LSCVGCDQEPPPPPPPSKVEKTEPPPPTEGSEEEVVEEEQEPEYTYDPTDRREPFESLIAEDVPTIEDLIITPTPAANLSPLQKFSLDELKLIGIILGGLGDYARISAPDGKSYTINIGTPMGKHEGKVISISDNVVLVKEIIRYESGTVEEVETPIYLNPIEEGETP